MTGTVRREGASDLSPGRSCRSEGAVTPATRYDYRALRDEFIRTPDLSIRELCRRHDIPDTRVSSVHDQAKKPDASGQNWYQLRERFIAKVNENSLTVAASKEVSRQMRHLEVVDNAVEAVDKAVQRFSESLDETIVTGHDTEGNEIRRPRVDIRAADVSSLMGRLLPLLGRPSQITEEHSFGVTVTADAESGPGVEILARLAAITRRSNGPRDVTPGASGRSPLPRAPDPLETQQP